MKKRGKINISVIILIIVILIALSHITISLIFPTSKTLDLAEGEAKSITGKISLSPEKLKDKYITLPPGSKLIIAGEWLAVILIIIIILIKGKQKFSKEMKVNKELTTQKSKIKYHKSKPETDLDILYKILKEKKSLRMSAISEIFKINKDIAMNWCKILEEGNLATIHYPTVGSPKIIINEENKEKGENEENKE